MDGVDYQIAAQNLQKLVPQKHVFWRMDILMFQHRTKLWLVLVAISKNDGLSFLILFLNL
jgi:hypothetical protein